MVVEHLEFASNEELQKFLDKHKIVILVFSGDWCGPCLRMGPEFERHAKEHENAMFVILDCDTCAVCAEENDIDCIPTFLAYKHGEEFDRFEGACQKSLERMIEKVFADGAASSRPRDDHDVASSTATNIKTLLTSSTEDHIKDDAVEHHGKQGSTGKKDKSDGQERKGAIGNEDHGAAVRGSKDK
ncbi:unnamed protein product [Amoebophrya sp. A120]|nr:unnamed protein product [Amoebophrya sp. A120]|eukprot:GSA120T00022611001.1